MIKLKNLFAKPLVTSNSKISPFTNETYDPQETTKPEEVVTSQPNELKTGRFLQKSRSFFPVHAPSRPKKNSLPPVMKKPPETQKDIGFDFEQFEELVDKKKLGLSREATFIINEDNEDRAAKARRHSWSVTDQGIAQHSVEMLKKFQFPPINTNLVSTGNVLASPTVRSPLNQSRVDETAGLLELGETLRKEYLSPAESFEELKVRERRKSTSSTGVRRTSEKTLSMIPQRGDFETTEAENNFNEEKRMSVKENKEHSFEQEEQRIDGNYENENIGSIEESSHQREMFKKLSVSLALTQRFDGSGTVLKPPSIQDMESSNSNLDSLVEENPFEDEITVRARTVSLKRQKTRIRDDKKYAGLKWLLFPDDTWKKVADIIIALGLVYTALVMPIRVTFIQDEPDDRLWPAFDWIIDGIFILDMVLTFFSAYFDGEENLVYQKKKIMMHYLTGWFVLDAISVAPFYLLNDGDNQSDRINNLVRVARLPRLYKLVKIVKLIRMVKIVKDRDKFKNYMNGILKLSAAYERMAVGTIGILLFCHIAACLWFTLVDLGDSPDDWLSTNELDYVPRFGQYIASFYFVVQTVVTVGYGELSPKTKEERLLACFLMIVGVLFYSIFIGFVSSLINDMDQMNQRFNHKLHILHRLQKDYSLPVFFVKKLKKAIKYESKQTIDSKLFVDHLPKQLSVELFCVMHKDIIDSIAFLQNRPKAFVAALCPLLKPITINKKDMIFTEGDPADEIFFVKSGTVGYVLPKYKNECFLKVREGYFFGEIDLLFYGETRKYTAMALKDCELYVLNKKDFKQVFLTSFRDIGNALCENAYKRKQRTRKAYKEALEICKSRQDDSHHKHKHSKLRLTLTKREKFGYGEGDSEDSEDSAEVPNALMGIVEEEEEEEEEILQPPPPAEEEEPEQIVIEPHKSLGGLSRLKAALALKRAFAPKSQMIQSLVMPSKESLKEEAKFGELNKKIDGLEAKLAKILTIGHAIRSQSSKDLNSPSLQNQSLALSRIIQTPTNKVKTPVDNASPSGSDSPMSTFRSPNALRRNIGLKKAENPAFKAFTSIKHFGLAASSAGPENESDRLLTQTARTTTQRETYGDVKTIGNSEHDPMVITDNNYEMKEEEEKGSSAEERERKEKEEDEKKMQPVYKLLFNLGKKKPVKEESLKAPGTPASQAEMSNLSKTKSNLEFEDF